MISLWVKFFLRIQANKESKVAAVALARMVPCILHHLLLNQEIYLENAAAHQSSKLRGITDK